MFSNITFQNKKRKRDDLIDITDEKEDAVSKILVQDIKKSEKVENENIPITRPMVNEVKNSSEDLIILTEEDLNLKRRKLNSTKALKKEKTKIEYSNCGCWGCTDFGRKFYPGGTILVRV